MKPTFSNSKIIKNDLTSNYSIWRYENFQNNKGFFPIFIDFTRIIGQLSPGAITLYIYFGLHSNTRKGTSFYSINRIAKDLHKSTRTISSWVNELVDNELIYRKQEKLNGVTTTYLRPYGD